MTLSRRKRKYYTPSVDAITLVRPANYKGHIDYQKSKKLSGNCCIIKIRPFDVKSYTITVDDYDWCDSYKRASSLWAFNHYYGKGIHPRTGETDTDRKKKIDDACTQGFHQQMWLFNTYEQCSNCKMRQDLLS